MITESLLSSKCPVQFLAFYLSFPALLSSDALSLHSLAPCPHLFCSFFLFIPLSLLASLFVLRNSCANLARRNNIMIWDVDQQLSIDHFSRKFSFARSSTLFLWLSTERCVSIFILICVITNVPFFGGESRVQMTRAI
jgi:hypothetical protein